MIKNYALTSLAVTPMALLLIGFSAPDRDRSGSGSRRGHSHRRGDRCCRRRCDDQSIGSPPRHRVTGTAVFSGTAVFPVLRRLLQVEDSTPVDGRKLRYQHRRAELLEQVTAYVTANGVGELSMRPLAKDLGISHATLIHHFGSKEQLLTEVVATLRDSSSLDISSGADIVEMLTSYWTGRTSAESLPNFRLMFEIYGQGVVASGAVSRVSRPCGGGLVGWFGGSCARARMSTRSR